MKKVLNYAGMDLTAGTAVTGTGTAGVSGAVSSSDSARSAAQAVNEALSGLSGSASGADSRAAAKPALRLVRQFGFRQGHAGGVLSALLEVQMSDDSSDIFRA